MKGRTVILVSHHVQLCAPGASYVVALDNGRLSFSGGPEEFKASGVMAGLVQSEQIGALEGKSGHEEQEREETRIEDLPSRAASSAASVVIREEDSPTESEASSTLGAVSSTSVLEPQVQEKKKPRKLIEEEKRAVGRIGKEIWKTYFSAVGSNIYWVVFVLSILLAAASPVVENGWLRYAPQPSRLGL